MDHAADLKLQKTVKFVSESQASGQSLILFHRGPKHTFELLKKVTPPPGSTTPGGGSVRSDVVCCGVVSPKGGTLGLLSHSSGVVLSNSSPDPYIPHYTKFNKKRIVSFLSREHSVYFYHVPLSISFDVYLYYIARTLFSICLNGGQARCD